MGTGRWGIEKSTEEGFMESLRWAEGVEGRGGEEEDHVAELVEQIAYAMLEDDDEETKQANLWGAHLRATEVSVRNCNKKREESVRTSTVFPEPVQKRVDSEAMELLYTELVRLKMEELAAAQQQLSYYQKALLDARQSPYSSFSSTDGFSTTTASLMLAEQHHTLDSFYNQQSHVLVARGGDWAAPNAVQCQGNGRSTGGQRLKAPLTYQSGRYPTRVAVPASRDSGGTGVFLPRCRAGARHLRNPDSKLKPAFEAQVSVQCPDALLPNKRNENVEDMSSLQYPSCSPLQEVAPDISLPTEWTY